MKLDIKRICKGSGDIGHLLSLHRALDSDFSITRERGRDGEMERGKGERHCSGSSFTLKRDVSVFSLFGSQLNKSALISPFSLRKEI